MNIMPLLAKWVIVNATLVPFRKEKLGKHVAKLAFELFQIDR
jgi:hypothetical protein